MLHAMVQVVQNTNSLGPPAGPIVVVILAGTTPFWRALATRCNVFANVWKEPAAHRQPKNWASWWVFDGGDDSQHLLRTDTKGALSAQVLRVEGGAGLEGPEIREPYVCAISVDGKAMAAGNQAPRRPCSSCMLLVHEFQGRLKVVDTSGVAEKGMQLSSRPKSLRVPTLCVILMHYSLT